jgi:hypothetical protein
MSVAWRLLTARLSRLVASATSMMAMTGHELDSETLITAASRESQMRKHRSRRDRREK